MRSISNLNPNVKPYVQDDLGIGNTDFIVCVINR